MKHADATNGGIDVYRIGIGRDIYLWHRARKIGAHRTLIPWIRRSWRRKSYWGIWQAESEVTPLNAARGLTSNAARRRLTRRINKVMTR